MANKPYRISFVVREYEDSNGQAKKVWSRCGTAWINKTDSGDIKSISLDFDFVPVPNKEFVCFPPQDRDEGTPF